MALTGLNHLTLAVRDLPTGVAFYVEVLGFVRRAQWDAGAYLTLGDLWLCLTMDAGGQAAPANTYTHFAFSIAQEAFPEFCLRLKAAGVTQWRSNASEGDSIYFLDPDGHRLEAHVGTLANRLVQCRRQPYAGMRFFDDEGAETV
ncbi:VOC family protein [Massilia sp. R2A-15]|uniref:VOC family protein n=1 Tax=Massilia sp. R2A-15 TaxID=3064278 RepID=UPI002734908F|nr:VOC family protein [Massilia sp. R2A-15]WLI89390.1 VOC family protein [Massilia sp. R2A-15]